MVAGLSTTDGVKKEAGYLFRLTDQSFPKQLRLTNREEFNQVFQNSLYKLQDKFFTLIVAQNSLGHARLGLAVGKRQIPLAVDRNTAKRLSRECFRFNHHHLPNFDIVLVFRFINVKTERSRLKSHLQNQFNQLVQDENTKKGC